MDPNVIVGIAGADDAGVYQITEDLAIIQSVDFFTPIVDDPYMFGQIAAANALSDIYAMGGEPKTAMNLVGFPADAMDISILREIIQGGIDKLTEAKTVLIGGHSVKDPELKYGLSVTGFIHPNEILTNNNIKPGDRLILTKPLGTGIINTAAKGGVAPEELISLVTEQMARLNKEAAKTMKDFPINACTDITGFGLLGHLAEMVENSDWGIELDSENIPVISEALDYAKKGFIPGGAYKNREFRGSMVDVSEKVPQNLIDVMYDPQTSGGLLISVDEKSADELITALEKEEVDCAVSIGVVSDRICGRIVVKGD